MTRRLYSAVEETAVGPCAADQYKEMMHGYMEMNSSNGDTRTTTTTRCSYGVGANNATSFGNGAGGTEHNGSPIPYLLAGLAAMLALIAVSLLILACSYWKLLNYNNAHGHPPQGQQGHGQQQQAHPNPNNNNGPRAPNSLDPSQPPVHSLPFDIEQPSKGLPPLPPCSPQDSLNRLAVIMAGQTIPTFLAQPLGKLDVKIQSP